jgi:hypothetical protein
VSICLRPNGLGRLASLGCVHLTAALNSSSCLSTLHFGCGPMFGLGLTFPVSKRDVSHVRELVAA